MRGSRLKQLKDQFIIDNNGKAPTKSEFRRIKKDHNRHPIGGKFTGRIPVGVSFKNYYSKRSS